MDSGLEEVRQQACRGPTRVQVKPLVASAHLAGISGHRCCHIHCYDRAISRPPTVRPAIPSWVNLPLVSEEQPGLGPRVEPEARQSSDLLISWNSWLPVAPHACLDMA